MEIKEIITSTIIEYLNENNFSNIDNVIYKRYNNGVEAILDGKRIGAISLYDYWSELEYIDDEKIKKNIIIPDNYEFVGMIESDMEGKGIATNMFRFAVKTTKKKGIAISKLFIAENSIHTIMKNLNAKSISDWYLLDK